MASMLSSRDVSGFKFLFFIAIMYAIISLLVHSVLHMKFIKPLSIDAPLDRFSEARAIHHVAVLTKDGRQEGRPGLRKAAVYIKEQLEMLKERAESNIRVEVEETTINGSFSMIFLGHSMSFAYRDHINIVARISSADVKETDPSVLINGHFDSPLGSPGAGDCGSCVASMLELARVTVESGWIPPRPLIFLFNGAEELFMLGSHGFMKTHKWRDSIGASINVEASGTAGPDLVCQSGPGSWPSEVYAESAVYPMAHSAAQDIFPVIPGDTDYRIFSQDHGNIPSLDIIFLLGGYYYHTSYDTLDKLLPGSLQARGDNLLSILKAFTNSSKLQSARERESKAVTNDYKDERAVFFDYLSWFLIFYSRRVAVVLHSIPIVIFFVMPFLLHFWDPRSRSCFAIFYDFVKGMLFHAAGIILAIIFPIILSILQLFFSNYALIWFAHPYLAFLMFIPCSLVGLLIPRTVWDCFPLSQDVSVIKKSEEALAEEARFWGAFGFYACLTSAYLVAGLSGGFLTFAVSASMLPAWIFFSLSIKSSDHQSLRSAVFYVIPLIPCLAYSVYFGGFLTQFLIEKMGMMGAVPPPYGYYVPDVVVAATVGVVTGWCVGPLIPVCSHWLARFSILQLLSHVSVLALALSSQFFPYSNAAPKRVVFQHTLVTTDVNRIVDSSYEFSVVDSNSLLFLFKYAPEVAKELHIGQELSFETANMSHRETWMGIFPVSLMFSQSLKFPARSDGILKRYRYFPHLSNYKPHNVSSDKSRRVYLEFYLGDLKEVWVAVLNITGPLSSWSFADNMLPAPETVDGGPPSYILRLSGNSQRNWTFWLEASSSDDLRVEVAVVDQVLDDEAKRLKSLFPEWADVIAYSSFMSSYIF
ncbi:endoplasmic reticulum metallopeptidase [Salix suchowensis]|nr:endoplasmic reticulum metallopeptidase [Salix suchowensis]